MTRNLVFCHSVHSRGLYMSMPFHHMQILLLLRLCPPSPLIVTYTFSLNSNVGHVHLSPHIQVYFIPKIVLADQGQAVLSCKVSSPGLPMGLSQEVHHLDAWHYHLQHHLDCPSCLPISFVRSICSTSIRSTAIATRLVCVAYLCVESDVGLDQSS